MEALLYDQTHKSPNCDSRNDVEVTILVLHYTAVDLPTSVFLLTDPSARRVSAHYLVPESGVPVHQLVPEEKRAWHAGVSHWRGAEGLNAHSVGIEIVNLGPVVDTPVDTTTPANSKDPSPPCFSNDPTRWHAFPEDQVQAVIKLCKEVLGRHNIPARNVVAHSDIAPTRKSDPGPVFPWKRLAENGIGIWPSPLPSDESKRLRPPQERQPSPAWCRLALQAWGYKVGPNGPNTESELDSETKSAVTAFQLHFRPSNFDGVVDAETCDILESLLIDHNIKI